jgi:hypothetical protein
MQAIWRERDETQLKTDEDDAMKFFQTGQSILRRANDACQREK